MATLATLRDSVAGKLGLDNTASSVEQQRMDRWINEGIVELLVRTHCTVETATMDTIADTWQYQFPTSIMAIRNIWREDAQGAVDPVIRVTEQEILDLHRTATSSNSTLRYATIRNLLTIWPTPSSVYALHIQYVPRPTAMTDGAHDPSSETYGRIPVEFHKAIEYYALWQGGEFDENRASQGGERYRTLFENYMSSVIRPAMQRKGGADQPQVRRHSWRSRRRSLARENDRY